MLYASLEVDPKNWAGALGPAFGSTSALLTLTLWRTPEACQEISRGLSERQRAQPPVIRSKKRAHPSGVRGVLAPLQGAIVVGFVGPVVRAKKRARTTG